MISIHALRGEGDDNRCATWLKTDIFQSTPSVGRATKNLKRNLTEIGISIHALRGEGDFSQTSAMLKWAHISIHALRGEGDHLMFNPVSKANYFNPRPPWGGRPNDVALRLEFVLFQSTPSVGRATNTKRLNSEVLQISIHALRGEGDDNCSVTHSF